MRKFFKRLLICVVVLLALILALVLSPLLLLVLLAPFRYRIDGQIGQNGQNGAQNTVVAKCSWFFHLFRVFFRFSPQEKVLAVKFSFFDIKPKKGKKEAPKKPPAQESVPAKERINQAKALLTNPQRKPIMALCIRFSKKMLKKVRPRRFWLRGVVGLEDPFSTVRLIGWYEALMGAARLRKAVNLQWDFSQKNLRLNLHAAGGFNIASLLGPVIWLFWQKPMRNALGQLLRHRKTEPHSMEEERKIS